MSSWDNDPPDHERRAGILSSTAKPSYTATAKTEKAARALKNVAKPRIVGQCWAFVRIHTGSAASRLFGVYSHCSKAARKGHLTCHWHQDREPAAQALRGKP